MGKTYMYHLSVKSTLIHDPNRNTCSYLQMPKQTYRKSFFSPVNRYKVLKKSKTHIKGRQLKRSSSPTVVPSQHTDPG